MQVSSASEAATANVDVATSGDNLVARQDGHSALVLNRSTGEIGKVDGALLRYTPQESVPGSSADLQLVAGGERAYVLDASQGHVRTYDSSDLSLVKDVPLAPGPTTAVVDSHGTLFAVNRTSGQVTVVDADGSSSRRTAGGRAPPSRARGRPALPGRSFRRPGGRARVGRRQARQALLPRRR